MLHKLRHNKKFGRFTADTHSDSEWVLLTEDGEAVIRQQKNGTTVFPQGTNPHPGRLAFRLEYKDKDGHWHTYDSQARAGDIVNQLDRLIQCRDGNKFA